MGNVYLGILMIVSCASYIVANCPSGYYGESCDRRCSQYCINDRCNATDGTCQCKDGATGPRCEPDQNVVTIVVGAIVGASVTLAIVASIVALVCCHQRASMKDKVKESRQPYAQDLGPPTHSAPVPPNIYTEPVSAGRDPVYDEIPYEMGISSVEAGLEPPPDYDKLDLGTETTDGYLRYKSGSSGYDKLRMNQNQNPENPKVPDVKPQNTVM